MSSDVTLVEDEPVGYKALRNKILMWGVVIAFPWPLTVLILDIRGWIAWTIYPLLIIGCLTIIFGWMVAMSEIDYESDYRNGYTTLSIEEWEKHMQETSYE